LGFEHAGIGMHLQRIRRYSHSHISRNVAYIEGNTPETNVNFPPSYFADSTGKAVLRKAGTFKPAVTPLSKEKPCNSQLNADELWKQTS
jgi:hypothetical protein